MADNRPPYHRRHTKPLPREELAPIAIGSSDDVDEGAETTPDLYAEGRARAAEKDAVTMCKCPLCCGTGMTTPEIASTFECLIKDARDKA